MKKKSVITIISVFLNLVLFAALAYFNKINSLAESVPGPIFLRQHISDIGYLKSDNHVIALANTRN
ncbi:MAG: hypothetical protein WDN00_15660 [Limisphaerales bacterium]